MFEDYELEVLKYYHEQKANGAFLNNLMHPSPSNLKNECVAVFDRRFLKKDENTLKSFFELRGDVDTYRSAIRKWDREKFKQANSVLTKGSVKTAEQNIELLAWLIDFEPRPYALWLKNRRTEKEQNVAATDVIDGGIDQKPLDATFVANEVSIVELPQPLKQQPKIIAGIILSVIVLVAIGYFAIGGRNESVSQGCMFWNGDQYQAISCSEKPTDSSATILALDSNKLFHFKRITRADTLTANSIGKVWYLNINGEVEYYTGPGEPPRHPGRRVLPLTKNILGKYPRHPG